MIADRAIIGIQLVANVMVFISFLYDALTLSNLRARIQSLEEQMKHHNEQGAHNGHSRN